MVWKYYDASEGKLTRLKRNVLVVKDLFLQSTKTGLVVVGVASQSLRKKGKKLKKESSK